MKILYNAQQLIPPLSGIGRYASILGKQMIEQEEIDKVTFFSPTAIHQQYPNFTNTQYSYSIISKIVRSNALFHHSADVLLRQYMNVQLKSYKAYIYHETNYNLVPFVGRKITTIHDLSFIHYREFHPIDRLRFFDRRFPKSLEEAQHFITDCEFVKEELIDRYGLAGEKISAIYLGVGDNFRPFSKRDSYPTLKKYALEEKKYILLVGNLEPRKNLASFIQAFELLQEKDRKDITIIHVGPLGWQNEDLLKRLKRMEEKGKFLSLGFIPEAELPIIYSNAQLLAFPSVYEGFGLPPLEAMACGTPVLATRTSSVPEVVGDAGKLTNPYDVDKMAADLAVLLNDEDLRKGYSMKGLARAKEFTWSKCIKNTLAVYQKVQNL